MGGQRKDRSWQGPERLREVRHGVATLTNAALERAGVAAAVSHASLRARGEGREAVIYTSAEEQAHVDAQREVLHRNIHPKENAANLAAWQAQKAREQLHDLSREAMVAHVRNAFWRPRPSPVQQREGQGPPASQPQQTRQASPQRARSAASDFQRAAQTLAARLRQRLRPSGLLAAIARAKAVIDAEQTGAALNVQLSRDTDRDTDRGMGW